MSSDLPTSVRRAPWLPLLTLGACLALAPGARAEDADANKKLAMDLFDRGVRQMREGRCDKAPVADRDGCEAARDALKRAFELYPEGLGALRNLAYVEAGLGMVASAARSFRELARRAPHDPSPARRIWADFARREADVLERRVPHLEIAFQPAPPPETTLLLDGAPLPEAAWRTPLDLDPGPHDVRAEAPGHAPYAARVELAEREHERISVALRADPAPTAETAARTTSDVEGEVEPAAPARRARLGPILTMSAGGAALAVGLGFGYRAMSERDAACGDTQQCEPDGLAAGKRAAHVSTALSSVGAAALASGLVWYFVSRKRERAGAQVSPAVMPGGALLQAGGSF